MNETPEREAICRQVWSPLVRVRVVKYATVSVDKDDRLTAAAFSPDLSVSDGVRVKPRSAGNLLDSLASLTGHRFGNRFVKGSRSKEHF